MPVYKRSVASETIVIRRAQNTVTTIAAFGSADGYATPGTEFGEDETIMVAGTVTADDVRDLTGVDVEVYLDDSFLGATMLYGYDGTNNYYQFTVGVLVEGTYTIEARFPRTKM